MLQFLARLLISLSLLSGLYLTPSAYAQSSSQKSRPLIAPKAKMKVLNGVATFTIKDRNTGFRDYFIVIRYAKNQKLFTRRKITAVNGRGVLVIRNIPAGKFTYATEAESIEGVEVINSPGEKVVVPIYSTSTPTPAAISSSTATATSASTGTSTATPTSTGTPTSIPPTNTATNTPSLTPTTTPTATPSSTPTYTATSTPTNTPTNTSTSTPSDTPTTTPTSTPTSTPTPPIAQLAAGAARSCARFYSGALRCWGQNNNGTLGYGNSSNIGDNETPSSAGDVSVGFSVAEISVGGSSTCALSGTGDVKCWGFFFYGQLGNPSLGSNVGDDELPSSIGNIDFGVGVTATQVSAGTDHSCILTNTANVICWGYNGNGELGYNNTNHIGDNETPGSAGNVNFNGDAIAQIAVGGTHSCAVTAGGDVYCWGDGNFGQLGYSSTNDIGDNETPGSQGYVNLGGAEITQVATGNQHSCALTDAGTVYCWGANGVGQLGYGNTTFIGDNEHPVSAGTVNLGGATAVQIVAGTNFTCARLSNASVMCWGAGSGGRLGYGNTNSIGDNENPTGTLSLGGNALQITTGNEATHACALLTGGDVRCWGTGTHGRLGYGNTNDIGDNELPSSAAVVDAAS